MTNLSKADDKPRGDIAFSKKTVSAETLTQYEGVL
jgi:hypothetical protein